MYTQKLLKNIYLSMLNIDDCCVKDWNFQKVTSPFTRLLLITSGEGIISNNQRKLILKPGYMYLIPSFSVCNYSTETFLGCYYITFVPQMARGTNIFNQLEFNYEQEANENDFRLMKRIFELNPGRNLKNIDPKKYSKEDLIPNDEVSLTTRQIATGMESQGILLQLFSRFIKTIDLSGTIPLLNSKIILALEYINTNLSKAINLAELAEICNLSNDYFSRLFLKTMGVRPIDYINRKRIEEAQMQLIVTNDSIEKIAIDLNIDNFSYFNRMFKKYSNCTAGEYRRLHRMI